MKIFNKYYRYLKYDIFFGLTDYKFNQVYKNFNRCAMQYKMMQICDKLENFNIPVIPVRFLRFLSMLVDFLRWKIYDICKLFIYGKSFNLYGVTLFCGRQGSGKTIGMVEYMDRVKLIYPDCLICTNFGYYKQDIPLTDWRQLLTLRNGKKGIIFAIDEIQNEYDNNKWKDFPDGLLSVITQQRKQSVHILLSSQVYTRVVKQIREQCFEVVECRTILGRWTRLKFYDATDYEYLISVDDNRKRMRIPKKRKYSFIQSNRLRSEYNTYEVVERMAKSDFIPRHERGSSTN